MLTILTHLRYLSTILGMIICCILEKLFLYVIIKQHRSSHCDHNCELRWAKEVVARCVYFCVADCSWKTRLYVYSKHSACILYAVLIQCDGFSVPLTKCIIIMGPCLDVIVTASLSFHSDKMTSLQLILTTVVFNLSLQRQTGSSYCPKRVIGDNHWPILWAVAIEFISDLAVTILIQTATWAMKISFFPSHENSYHFLHEREYCWEDEKLPCIGFSENLIMNGTGTEDVLEWELPLLAVNGKPIEGRFTYSHLSIMTKEVLWPAWDTRLTSAIVLPNTLS